MTEANTLLSSLSPAMIAVIDIVLMTFLVIVAVVMFRLRDLFAVVMLSGLYSLASAAIFTTLDAVDVAFTEASVGAGISTVLMLGTLALMPSAREKITARARHQVLPLLLVFATGAALVYGTADMPAFGDPAAPVHSPVSDHYIRRSGEEVGVPNIVTSVLASYRGYDTLGETTVIFTAAIAVLLLIGRPRRRQEDSTSPSGNGETSR